MCPTFPTIKKIPSGNATYRFSFNFFTQLGISACWVFLRLGLGISNRRAAGSSTGTAQSQTTAQRLSGWSIHENVTTTQSTLSRMRCICEISNEPNSCPDDQRLPVPRHVVLLYFAIHKSNPSFRSTKIKTIIGFGDGFAETENSEQPIVQVSLTATEKWFRIPVCATHCFTQVQ